MSVVVVHISHSYQNMDTTRKMHQSVLGADGEIFVVPNGFEFGHCSSSLGYPGEYLGFKSLIRYYSPQIFQAMGGLQYFVTYGNVSADAIGVVCYQLGLLSTDLRAICSGGLFKVIYQLYQLLLLSS